MKDEFIHSVTLDRSLCMGCINCIKRCPTQAIRVRDGKAAINAQRCIDSASYTHPTLPTKRIVENLVGAGIIKKTINRQKNTTSKLVRVTR